MHLADEVPDISGNSHSASPTALTSGCSTLTLKETLYEFLEDERPFESLQLNILFTALSPREDLRRLLLEAEEGGNIEMANLEAIMKIVSCSGSDNVGIRFITVSVGYRLSSITLLTKYSMQLSKAVSRLPDIS